MPAFDPIQVEVWRHLLSSIAEEMGAALERTGFSPNIKERRDHSCALFDSEGRLLAQAAHIPVHLGAMPILMEQLRHSISWNPGSMWLCNDPAHGGTHLPDFTLVMPVYHAEKTMRRLLGFVANRAHHADIGGLAPGSLPLSTELFHEGLIIPPVRLVAGGRIQPDIAALICANSRTPSERRGDLAAQAAANETGARRLCDLAARFGRETFDSRAAETRAYAQDAVRKTLEGAPEGEYLFEDVLDDDGAGTPDIRIRVVVRIRGGRITFDFTGSAPETAGPVNATAAVTRSACAYVLRCLIEEDIPMNDGVFRAMEVIAPEGSVVNARFPRAVSAGNVETSQRIVDVALAALAPAFPNRIPAMSQGTMNNLLIGGIDPARSRGFAYYETIAGGAGASPDADGASAIHTHMTNTRNTPIEALEMHYPLRVREYSIRRGSGGQGARRGGDGIVRAVELRAQAAVSLVTERRTHAPAGAAGGEPGCPGSNRLALPDGEVRELPPKWSGNCPAATVITIETPGGGGWGAPAESQD